MDTVDVCLPPEKVQELMGETIGHYLNSQATFGGPTYTLWDLALSAYFMGVTAGDFGNKNKDLGKMRRARGWSQKDLADRLGISRTYLSQIERRKAHSLSLNLALLLARELGCSVDVLEQKSETETSGGRP